MRPYPDGWAEMNALEQLEGLKEILVAIWRYNAKVQQDAGARQKPKGKRTHE